MGAHTYALTSQALTWAFPWLHLVVNDAECISKPPKLWNIGREDCTMISSYKVWVLSNNCDCISIHNQRQALHHSEAVTAKQDDITCNMSPKAQNEAIDHGSKQSFLKMGEIMNVILWESVEDREMMGCPSSGRC